MRSFFKPLLLLFAAVNLFLLAMVVGRDGGGSTIAGELMPLGSTYRLGDLFLTQRVASLVEHQYVDPNRVNPEKMFQEALEQVQRDVPEALFTYTEGSGVVDVRMDKVTDSVQVGPMTTVNDVVDGLRGVLGFVGEHWEGEPDKLQEVEYAAINGMLSTLDPHSILLPPDNAKQMDVQIQGQFGGLGITISLRGEEATLTIVSVLDETPAMRAGLKAGDQILQIDGESTVNIDLEDAVSKLRGPVGSKVEILVNRKTFEEPTVFRLRRDVIQIESVETSYLGDGYGLIKIKAFQHNSYQQLIAGLTELKSHGPLKGLILDLRNNPGGPLQQAVDISDRFIDAGEIVSTVQSYSRQKEVKRAHRSGTEEPYPMVVIMDSQSASASEIVAGALKNNDRAVVIGETSFGKGSVQNLFQNPDDSKLKLTMLQYLTPGGQSIQSVGITPDVRLTPVYFDRELAYFYSTAHMFRERDLEEHLDGDPLDYQEQDPPLATFRYYAPEEFVLPGKTPEPQLEDAEPKTPDPLEDFQVRFARDLLVEAGRATRQGTLAQAQEMLKKRVETNEQRLVEEMQKIGVDWQAGAPGAGPVDIAVRFDGVDGALKAGDEITVTMSLTNRGTTPLARARGITRSDLGLLNQIEFLYGRVEPGETREWSRKVKMPDSMMSLAEPVTFEVYQGDEDKLAEHLEVVEVLSKVRPAFAWSVVPIDDGSGTSRGNGDGRIQRGETIDLLLMVKNTGEGPSKRAYFRLSNEEGRHVYLKSGTLNLDEIAPGAVVARRLGFEVKDTLPQDSITLSVRSGDATLLGQPEVKLVLPVAASVPTAIGQDTHNVKVKRSASALSSPADGRRFAELPAGTILASDGRLGDWVRVRVPVAGEVVPGWIEASDTTKAGSASLTASVDPWLQEAPPAVNFTLVSLELPAGAATLELPAIASDNTSVRKVYAFVNGQKRYFYAVPEESREGASIPLSMSLPLEDGANLVEIYAHDDEDTRSARYFQVYRDKPVSQAAVAPE